MAGLLVSVRSAEEAREALAGGATLIDIKDPDRGPLGRAGAATWEDVRRTVPGEVPVSVALGELREYGGGEAPRPADVGAIAYRKLGLSGSGPGWDRDWSRLRESWGAGPSWVAVAYADWREAGAPDPFAVLEQALSIEDCAAVLVDTWDKSRPSPIDLSWEGWLARARGGGLKVALAGGLDVSGIVRLGPLRPDWFAVRGAACRRGDRREAIDAGRVARLVDAARAATSD